MTYLPRGRDAWRRRANLGRGLGLLFSLTLIIGLGIIAACGGDDPPPGPIDCTFRGADRYSYTSSVTFDLAPRPDNAPPETPDRGSDALKLVQTFTGGVQAPDRAQATIKTENSQTADLQVVIIGGDTYTRLDPGPFQKTNGPATEIYTVGHICEVLAPDLNFGPVQASQEDVSGVTTQHYQLPALETKFPARLYGEGSDFAREIPALDVDVWLDENKRPARIAIDGTGRYDNGRTLRLAISTEITKLNDDSVNIQAPQ